MSLSASSAFSGSPLMVTRAPRVVILTPSFFSKRRMFSPASPKSLMARLLSSSVICFCIVPFFSVATLFLLVIKKAPEKGLLHFISKRLNRCHLIHVKENGAAGNEPLLAGNRIAELPAAGLSPYLLAELMVQGVP